MKFRYGYRTKDNEKVEGVISATSREDVYAQLRREGRKPYMVEPLPGLLNRLSGISKRWLAIAVLAGVCVALAIAVGRVVLNAPQSSAVEASLDAPVRRQPIGDAAIIDKGIREGWADVFTLEGDRFLASFAVPGTPPAIRSTTEEKVREALDHEPSKHPNLPNIQTSLEARQIRAMVEGMKQELREFLADGGTIKQYGHRLVQRQEAELGYYHRAKAELDRAIAEKRGNDAINALVEKHNAALRKIGVKLLVLPD